MGKKEKKKIQVIFLIQLST